MRLISRIRFLADAGGSWGAPWEASARTPAQYQQAALDAMARTVSSLGIGTALIAALSLTLHTVSRILAQWRALAIRCALGATMRHLFALAGRDLLQLGALGSVFGLLLGGGIVALLSASWPVLISRPTLVPAALLAAAAATLVTWLVLALVSVVMLVLLQRGVRTVSELHGAGVTSGGPVMLLQSVLVVLQLAGLLVVTYASVLIIEQGLVVMASSGIDTTNRAMIAPLHWADDQPRAALRAAGYRAVLPALDGPASHRAALASPDAWLGLGKELALLSFCGECRRGMFFIPVTTGMMRIVAVAPGALATRTSIDGRDFSAADTLGAPRVAIANFDAADRLFPGTNPVGKRFRTGLVSGTEYRVIGYSRHRAPNVFGNTEHPPVMFVSLLQHPPAAGEITAPANVWDSLRQRIAPVQPDAPLLGRSRDLAERIQEFIDPIGWFGVLFAGLAGSATGIASWSLVAVMNQMIRMRERDIAIRMAVGAQVKDIERWVVRRTLWLTLWGVTLGLSGARWVSVALHGEQGSAEADLFMLFFMVLAFGGMGIVAGWMPARRAARIEPAVIWAEPRA